MNETNIAEVVAQIDALENKRNKFKFTGIACGLAAVFPVWAAVLGQFFFVGWLAALICGFTFRSVAVKARDDAMRLRLSIANLPGSPYNSQDLPYTPNLTLNQPITSSVPKLAPTTVNAAPPGTTESRLNKARRRK